MSEPQSSRNIPRSVLAIFAGIVVGVALSLGTDELLHVTGIFPPWGASMAGYDRALLYATLYRTAYGVFSSYLTARIAPSRPMLHSMILATLGFLVSILGAAATWNKGPAFGSHWYPVTLIVLAYPTAWFGAKLRLSQIALPLQT